VRDLDLGDPLQSASFLSLLDHYARDPMGGGEALAMDVCSALPEALSKVAGFHGAMAWHGDQAIGLINCFTGFSTFKAKPLLNVHDLVVHADWRGQRVAAALLDWAARRARELGCCKLTLEVLANNHMAKRCYQRAGFAPYVLDPAAGAAELMQRFID
jgi:GNAT superfamily N-acetyltransferase